jgi:hypothetical protein
MPQHRVQTFQFPSYRRSSIPAVSAYVSEDPLSTFFQVHWGIKDLLIALSNAQHNKHGTTFAHVVWKDQRPSVVRAGIDFHIEEAEYLNTIKAENMKVLKSGASAIARPLAFDQVALTSRALIITLLHWSSNLKCAEFRTQATNFLYDWLTSVLGDLCVSVEIDYSDLRLPEPVCNLEPRAGCACPHVIADYLNLTRAGYCDALSVLFQQSSLCRRAKATMLALVDEREYALDGAALCASSDTADPTRNPLPMGGKRHRNISPHIRAWVHESVSSKRHRSEACAVRGLGLDIANPSSSGADFTEVQQRAYFWSSAALVAQTQHIAVATDGSDLGEDTSTYCFWLRKFQVGSWGVPQAQ